MKNTGISLKFIALACSLILFLTACTGAETPDEIPSEPDEVQNPNKAKWKDHDFTVYTVVAGSTSILSVKDKYGKEVCYGNAQVPTVYGIKQSVPTDMNGDGLPEMIVLLTDFEMNSPMLKAFTNVGRGRLMEIRMPDLPQEVYDTYQGGDLITAKESSIDYSINYISNGTPVRSTFNFIWDSEAGEIKVIEQR